MAVLLLIGLWGAAVLPGASGAMGTLTPPYSDSGLDTDGNGQFDYLVVEASIDVTEANAFLVAGELHDENFTFGVSAENVTTLGVGLQAVTLWFYGPEINASGVDGPYLVELYINDYSNFTFLDNDTYTTGTYNHTDFDGFPALLEPPHGDHGLDTDGDGRFNHLVVDVSLNVSEAGTYSIDGFLRNANYSLTLSTSNETSLSAGVQTVQLFYTGSNINASGADGPYTVNIDLTDVGTFILLDSGTHITAAYSHLDFEEPPVELLPPHSDLGLDTDTDGLFDFLVVDVSVNVTENDTYVFQGTLHDANWTLIVSASNTTDLGLGAQAVQLQFMGSAINASGIDGPYTVELSVRQAATFDLIDSGDHTTAPYNHTDFEGPLALFAPLHSDFPLDTDGDGQIDYLVANVTIQVNSPGNFVVFGSITFGPPGSVSTLNITSLDPGIHVVPLWFYGPGLRSGASGPYMVGLSIVELTTFTFLDTDTYSTGNYSPADFEGAEQLLSAPATVTPTIDGTFSTGEWGDATVVNLAPIPGNRVPALLHVKNDADRVYLAYDATGDTTEDLMDTGSIAFDTGNDDITSDGAEDEFLQGDGFQSHYVYDASFTTWTVEDSPYNPNLPNHQGLESAIGFGPSENSPIAHRVYEFAVPRNLLGLQDGEIGFHGASHPSPGVLDASMLLGYSVWPVGSAGPLPLWAYGDLILAEIGPPLPTIILPTGGATIAARDVEVQWTVADGGSGVDHFEVTLDTGTPVVLPSSASSYTFTGVADGAHSVTLAAFDSSGKSQAATVDFTVDASPPTLSVDSPGDDSFLNTSTVEVTWTAGDAGSGIDRFEVTLDGGSPETLAGTSNSHTFVDLADGLHTVNVTAVDQVGNARTVLLGLTVDTVPPTISITSPAANSVVPSSNVDVVWEAEDATSGMDHYEVLFLDGTPVTLPGTATSYTLSGVADGGHSIAVMAVDRAGNEQSQTVGFSVDTNIFSPTGPFGVMLIVVIPVAVGGAAAVVLLLWFRKRGAG